MQSDNRRTLIVVVSHLAGFFLMYPLVLLFNHMGWPYFNSWAMSHGAFVIAWPLLYWISRLSLELLFYKE